MHSVTLIHGPVVFPPRQGKIYGPQVLEVSLVRIREFCESKACVPPAATSLEITLRSLPLALNMRLDHNLKQLGARPLTHRPGHKCSNQLCPAWLGAGAESGLERGWEIPCIYKKKPNHPSSTNCTDSLTRARLSSHPTKLDGST